MSTGLPQAQEALAQIEGLITRGNRPTILELPLIGGTWQPIFPN